MNATSTWKPLVQREWLQHRFAWAMLILVPLALALLPLTFGQVQIGQELAERAHPELALMLGGISIIATVALLTLLLWVVSLFMTIGTPRRDHADRSIEFWLSLPSGHAAGLAVPVLVHMLLVPAGALLAGYLGGIAVSLVLVSRFVGIGEWVALPWGVLLPATMSLVLRLMAGLPLVLLWLLPLLMLAMLANALFKRWGLPVLVGGLLTLALISDQVFGSTLVTELLASIFRHAGQSLAGASDVAFAVGPGEPPAQALGFAPAWAWQDFVAALKALGSPLMGGGLVVSAALFFALIQWRARGAGAAG
jgi:ABC-2 type transport system permease protein